MAKSSAISSAKSSAKSSGKASAKPSAKSSAKSSTHTSKSSDMSPTSRKRAHGEDTSKQTAASKRSKGSSEGAVAASSPRSLSPETPPPVVNKANWQGFCEIESDPIYFSAILREIGVQDVDVRQVPFLDPEILLTLPQPIYGLVLLFRQRLVDPENEEKECPGDVWFANQMPAQNSCATLAMVNTVLNNADIDVGEHLRQFREFTTDMSPRQRGEAFASFEFVKRIHNSFVKEMDILESDKHLAYKVSRAAKKSASSASDAKKKKQQQQKRRPSQDSTISNESAASFEDNSHHFIAFVPVAGCVWKLDGMDAQPTAMGSYEQNSSSGSMDWALSVSDKIADIMATGDMDYDLLAITKTPLSTLRERACLSVNATSAVEKRLDALDADWKKELAVSAEDDETEKLREPLSPSYLSSFSITTTMLSVHKVPAELAATIDVEDKPEMLLRWDTLLREQYRLKMDLFSEQQDLSEAVEKAEQRRHDLGPAIKRWLEMLAENGYLEKNLSRFMR